HPRYDTMVAVKGPHATSGEREHALAAVVACAEWVRADLRARYGWTALEHEVSVDRPRREIVLGGRAVLWSVVTRFAQPLRGRVAEPWRVRLVMTAAQDAAPWTVLDGLTRVWRETSRRNLATEYFPADGPVQTLARVNGLTMIRGH